MDGKVLCGASAEQLKYYFNPEFSRLPEAVQQELHDITVVMADRIGATFLMVFVPDGSLRRSVEVVDDRAFLGEVRERVGQLLGEGLAAEGDLAHLREQPEVFASGAKTSSCSRRTL